MFTVTSLLDPTVAVTPPPVKFKEVTALVILDPSSNTAILGDPVLVAGDQVLSPLKNVVLDGVPVADSDAVKVPLLVIGPPAILINVESAVATLVTVPVPDVTETNAAKLAIVKPFVSLSLSILVPRRTSFVVGVAAFG